MATARQRQLLVRPAPFARQVVTGNMLADGFALAGSSWTRLHSSATAAAAIGPDGTQTAVKLIEDATATITHEVDATFTGIVGTYVFSVWAHALTRSNIVLQLNNATDGNYGSVRFDLAAGAVSTVTSGLGAIRTGPNSWYYCRMAATAGHALSSTAKILLQNGISGSYTGDGTSGLYLWGAKLSYA